MKKVFLVFGLSVLVLVLFSCSQLNLFEPRKSTVSVVLSAGVDGSGDSVKPQEYSSLDLQGLNQRTEAPWIKDIEHLYVKITKFSYRYSTGPGAGKWATPTIVEKEVDLVNLTDEATWLTFDIPNGAVIVALAFEVTQATVTINGSNYAVTIPAEKGRVVIPNLNWQVKTDESQIVLSIDWTRSIVKTTSESYMLVPRVAYRWRGELKKLWAIYGNILINDATPTVPLLIGLFEGTDTTATPTVLKMRKPRDDAYFWLGKHPAGTYTVVVWDNIKWEWDGENYSVTGRKATETTFEHGKTKPNTELHLRYSTSE
uniref:DUF4382 domain-containing protein n=1 Tax=Fervidobacterium pennivorans TaxID=93466 RepID=A0A7V4KDI5_FERPE